MEPSMASVPLFEKNAGFSPESVPCFSASAPWHAWLLSLETSTSFPPASRARVCMTSHVLPWCTQPDYCSGDRNVTSWRSERRERLHGTAGHRALLRTVVELKRERYRFGVIGCVVMTEHVQLLLSEPLLGD